MDSDLDEAGSDKPEGAPAWMATFGDLMSLLLTFFVLLLSFANMDVIKFSAAVASLQDAFGTLQLQPGHLAAHTRSVVDLSDAEATPQLSVINLPSRAVQERTKLLQKVRILVAGLELENLVEVEEEQRGVVVRIPDHLLFDGGSTELRPESLPLLDALADLVKALDAPLAIEGHTDSSPAPPPTTNWHISADRAIATLRYLTDVRDVDARSLSATGFADVRPLVPNATAKLREKNRRVEFVFLEPAEEQTAAAVRPPGGSR